MKTCPVCGAKAFDDAEVCYGCLHRFASGQAGFAAGCAPDEKPPGNAASRAQAAAIEPASDRRAQLVQPPVQPSQTLEASAAPSSFCQAGQAAALAPESWNARPSGVAATGAYVPMNTVAGPSSAFSEVLSPAAPASGMRAAPVQTLVREDAAPPAGSKSEPAFSAAEPLCDGAVPFDGLGWVVRFEFPGFLAATDSNDDLRVREGAASDPRASCKLLARNRHGAQEPSRELVIRLEPGQVTSQLESRRDSNSRGSHARVAPQGGRLPAAADPS